MHEKMVALSEPMIAEAPEPAIQTQIVTECLHDAGLPAGVFNIVNGRGDVAGAELTGHPDVAKISFTGSTVTGKAILSASAETMKRVTLELGGKSPTLILDDADLTEAVPIAVGAGFLNSGQACGAGTRILVPADRLAEVATIAQEVVARMKVGDPREPPSCTPGTPCGVTATMPAAIGNSADFVFTVLTLKLHGALNSLHKCTTVIRSAHWLAE